MERQSKCGVLIEMHMALVVHAAKIFISEIVENEHR